MSSVYCTVNKRNLLVISKIISISGDSRGDTDAVCCGTFTDSDWEDEEKGSAWLGCAAGRWLMVTVVRGAGGHRSTGNGPKVKEPQRLTGGFLGASGLTGRLISQASSTQMQFASHLASA